MWQEAVSCRVSIGEAKTPCSRETKSATRYGCLPASCGLWRRLRLAPTWALWLAGADAIPVACCKVGSNELDPYVSGAGGHRQVATGASGWSLREHQRDPAPRSRELPTAWRSTPRWRAYTRGSLPRTEASLRRGGAAPWQCVRRRAARARRPCGGGSRVRSRA